MTQKDLISSIFRREILAMSAYKVADASGLIKLDAMENPYTWPDKIIDQWLEKLRHCELNRYPDPDADTLSATLKQLDRFPEHCEILLGNGSDEIIQLLLMALPVGSTVLAPKPTFVMYRQISQVLGLNYQDIPLLENSFELDPGKMMDAIHHHQPAIVFLAFPNNPTGNLFNTDTIDEILKAAPGLVVLDEAYAPFANASNIEKLTVFDNLLVMRTVSKLGLAGLRLGYIVGIPSIIEQLNKIRLPYNINILTQISADFALSNISLFDEQTRKIRSERARVFKFLDDLDNITAYPSAANFILFRTEEEKANLIFSSLKQQGILIKNTSPQGGLLSGCLRVTIGKPEENNAFMIALQKSLLTNAP